MLQAVAAILAVLLAAAVAVAHLLLVVGDVRRRRGEPPAPDAQRSLDAHRDAERRVNEGARTSVWHL